MQGGIQYCLVDGDHRRRAQITRHLLGSGIHAEPFEDVAELIARWPRTGLILAHDEGATLSSLMEHMCSSVSWLPVVAYAEAPATRSIVRAIHEGAVDYIAWPFDDAELAATLELARETGKQRAGAKLREAMARSRIERLSAREREVLGGVASGLSNDLIAKRLGISSRTVEIHRANMLSKIGANHTSEAIRIAVEASLLH